MAAESLFSPHQQTWKRESLLRELSACREELASMRALLNDLPQIFEGKFETRLEPLMEQKQRLLEGNQDLREQLRQLQPAEALSGQLMPAADPPLPPSHRRQAWGRSLRHAFGLDDRQR
jgi:Mg2+ and Co2+ transporter CorA